MRGTTLGEIAHLNRELKKRDLLVKRYGKALRQIATGTGFSGPEHNSYYEAQGVAQKALRWQCDHGVYVSAGVDLERCRFKKGHKGKHRVKKRRKG